MPKTLEVRLLGASVGVLLQRDDGRMEFTYHPAYLGQPGNLPVSLAMPLTDQTYDHRVCHAVFGGMLPEGEVRGRLAKALGVSERNDFSMLAEIGGECAGAVSLWPLEGPGSKPGSGLARKLTTQDLENFFKKLSTRPLLTGEGVRLSLAGAQNKLALAGKPDNFHLPADDEPSTYILKTAPEDYDGILLDEYYCMRLAALVGLPAAKVWLGRAGSVDYLCVERFDREHGPDTKNRRLHQEDFCQALGVAPENKYQSEGGPNLADGVELIRKHSVRPAADLAAYLRLAYFNYLIGNSDAHAKNYSLLWGTGGLVLAPAYDVLSTAIFPNLHAKMAMKIGSEYDPDRVAPRHWESFAKSSDLKPSFVLERLKDLADRVQAQAPVLAKQLAGETPESKVLDQIQAVIQKRVARLG